jgi:hypothetical protein
VGGGGGQSVMRMTYEKPSVALPCCR